MNRIAAVVGRSGFKYKVGEWVRVRIGPKPKEGRITKISPGRHFPYRVQVSERIEMRFEEVNRRRSRIEPKYRGSGSTLVAAKRGGWKYVEIANRRLAVRMEGRNRFDMSVQEMAEILAVDESTFHRYRTGFVYGVAERLGWY